ncbi:MAG: hypothetical protein ACYTAF_09920, partial [Planctomycetota bacterium]
MRRVGFAILMILSLAAAQDDTAKIQLREGFEKTPVKPHIYPGWERVGEQGFPVFNRITVDRNVGLAHGGEHYLRMETKGSGTALEMVVRSSVNVRPQYSYYAEVYVRLQDTRRNSAVLAVRWLDKFARVLRENRSFPLTKAPAWTPIRLHIPRIPEGTRWGQVRLIFEGKDFSGECHFDDLQLVGQPRIEVLPVDRRAAIFEGKENAAFDISVPRFTEPGKKQLVTRVVNRHGRVVGAEQTTRAQPGKMMRRSYPLAPGYYELESRLEQGREILAEHRTPFAVLGGGKAGGGDLVGTVFNPFHGVYTDVRAYIKALGVRRAKVVVWGRPGGGRDKPPDMDEIHKLVRTLVESDIPNIIGVLGPTTPERFPGVDRATLQLGPLALLSADPGLWADEVKHAALRLGEWIFLWQVGADDDPAAVDFTGVPEALDAFRQVLRGQRRISSIALPVPFEKATTFDNPGADTLAVHVPETVEPQVLKILDDYHYVLEVPSMGSGPALQARVDQAAEFLRRGIELFARAGTNIRVYVPLDIGEKSGLLNAEGHPRPPFLALRALNTLLRGRTFLEGFHLMQVPVEDRVFIREDDAVVAFWTTGEDVRQKVFLGPDAMEVDPLGTVRPVPSGTEVVATRLPKFITGINTLLLKTQSSLQFYEASPTHPRDPDILDNTLAMRTDAIPKLLKMKNYFKEKLENVRVTIREQEVEKKRWTIRPLSMSELSLEPDKEFRKEMLFTLPRTELAKPHRLKIYLAFEHKGRTYSLVLERTLVTVPQI